MMYSMDRKWAPLWVMVVYLAMFSLGVAQDDAAADGGGGSADRSFINVYLSGGSTMIFLTILSVLMLTFTVEGFIKLRKAKLAPPAVVALLRDSLAVGNYQQAWEICRQNPCFLTKVLGAALERIGKGRDIFEGVLGDTGAKEAMKLKNNLNYLSVVGVVAPMFGLFGTVLGMIGAFNTLADKGVTDFGKLSGNISEALVTTAGGLVVGIPAFILYYVLRSQGQLALAAADTEINLLVEDFPLDQLVGLKVGDQAAAGGMPGAAPMDPNMGGAPMAGGMPPPPAQPGYGQQPAY